MEQPGYGCHPPGPNQYKERYTLRDESKKTLKHVWDKPQADLGTDLHSTETNLERSFMVQDTVHAERELLNQPVLAPHSTRERDIWMAESFDSAKPATATNGAWGCLLSSVRLAKVQSALA